MNLTDRYQIDNLEISRLLTLSTAHITEEVNERLGDENMRDVMYPALSVYTLPYGFMFPIIDNEDYSNAKDLPDCLKDIVRLAQLGEAQWVILDADGPIHPGLPAYDW